MRPWDLVPGDVVLFGATAFEVLSEPFAGVSGTSLFDSPELFCRAEIRASSPGTSAMQPGRRMMWWQCSSDEEKTPVPSVRQTSICTVTWGSAMRMGYHCGEWS